MEDKLSVKAIEEELAITMFFIKLHLNIPVIMNMVEQGRQEDIKQVFESTINLLQVIEQETLKLGPWEK